MVEFCFDFGTNWHFLLILEAVGPPGEEPAQPEVVKFHGEAPGQYPEHY